MSYKFQSGAASLGGSISATALSGAISADSMSDGVNAILTAGSALTKTFSDVGDSVTLDVAVDDSSIEVVSDALQVKALGITDAMLAGSISNAKLANSTISGKALGASLDALSQGAGIAAFSYDGSASGVTIALSASVAGDGLAFAAGVLSVGVDDSSIELSGDAVQVKAAGITNAMLSGAIADGKLASDYVQVTEVDDSTVEWSGTALRVKDDGITLAKMAGLAAGNFILGDVSGNPAAVAMSGDATMSNAGVVAIGAGKVTNTMLSGAIADSKLLAISTAGKVLGSAVQLETNGGIANNTGLGLVLKANDGLQLSSGELALKFDSTAFTVTSVGGLELASSVAGAGISLSAGVLSAQQTVQATGDADYTAVFGLNINNANYTQARTVTLPSADADDAGKVVLVKARNADQYALTVQRAGSDVIDGSLTSVDIESASGAITLMCAGAGNWVIV